MAIEFGPCPACGRCPPRPNEAKPDWAAFAGWDGCVRWLRDSNDAPPLSGHVRQIAVSYPFRGEIGEVFWCLWAPFDAYESGYSQFPELLQQSRMVEVHLQEVLSLQTKLPPNQAALVAVEVLRCLSYSELLELPQIEAENLANLNWLRRVQPDFCTGELCFAEINLEGDVGSWAVWVSCNGLRHLLLEGTWGSHESYVFAGHLRLVSGSDQM